MKDYVENYAKDRIKREYFKGWLIGYFKGRFGVILNMIKNKLPITKYT